MSLLKEELSYKISNIPDKKLSVLKPIIDMLFDDTIIVERVNFEDLTEGEKESVILGQRDIENGDTIDFEDYLQERGIDATAD